MKAAMNIHEVTAIRVKEREPLTNGGASHWRDIEIETADGELFVVTTFTDGASAAIEVADTDEQTDVPERHREAG